MKTYLQILCVLFCSVVLGQELKTKKIKEKLEAFPKTKKVYNVLNANKNIKHGKYEEFYKKTLRVSGSYDKGEKHGEWRYTDISEKYLQKGSFDHGKEVGYWESKMINGNYGKKYYNDKGRLDSAFYFNKNNQLLSSYTSDSSLNGSININNYDNGFKEVIIKKDSMSITEVFYPNEQLFHRKKEEGDKLVSASDYYNDKGTVFRKSKIKEGNGMLFTFYLTATAEGKPIGKSGVMYKKGKPNGTYTSYDIKGKLMNQGDYLNGNKVGEWKMWSKKKKKYISRYIKGQNKEYKLTHGDKPYKITKDMVSLTKEDKKGDLTKKERFSKIVNKNILLNLDVKSIAQYITNPKEVCKIVANFKMNTYGEIVDVKVKAPHPKIEEEVILVLQKMATFQPASQYGKFVNLLFSLPIHFRVN